jgi:tetratricopeptide (TPR) repeat protein
MNRRRNNRQNSSEALAGTHATHGTDRTLRRILFALCCSFLAGSSIAIACGWMGPFQSVRFNSRYTERELERLPPLSLDFDGKKRPTNEDPYGSYDYEEEAKHESEIAELWQNAEKAETEGDFTQERNLLREYLNKTRVTFEPPWGVSQRRNDRGHLSGQEKRNSAFDRLDTIETLTFGASPQEVQHYLDARSAFEADSDSDVINSELESLAKSRALAANVAYLRAAMLYRAEDWEGAETAFRMAAKKFPHSNKADAAAYMAALSALKQSEIYLSVGECHTSEDCADVRDEHWKRALAGFERLARAGNGSRFSAEARGWIAFQYLKSGDRARALVEYYRLLATSPEANAKITALTSLRLTRPGATEEDIAAVEAALEKEPRVALIYSYHGLYNYSFSLSEWDEERAIENQMVERGEVEKDEYGSLSSWAREKVEEKAKQNLETKQKRGIEHMARFAAKMMQRFPGLMAGDAFALKVAEANLETGDNHAALQLAQKALRLPLGRDQRDEALWVKGLAQYRLKEFSEAIHTLNTLVRENPKGALCEGARRILALVLEDSGDLEGALEQYVALDYLPDIAYYTDVLMTPEQLSTFVEHHPKLNNIDEMWYSLGVRYMRAERWSDARTAFARVRTALVREKRADDWYGDDSEERNTNYPKRTSLDGPPHAVQDRWVLRDLKTVTDLENLQRNISTAVGDEAKAEAMYQYASYIHQGTTLLFYNPAFWRGNRYWLISDFDERVAYRLPNEAETLWEYMQDHESPSRALKVYLEIVRLYPKTIAAHDALFTAAVCEERLSGYNNYWRERFRNELYPGARFVSYGDVKAAYRNYVFPKGTLGWEPMNRTVNGASAWPPKPKTAPRLTRTEKVERYLARARNWGYAQISAVKTFWETKIKYWAYLFLAIEVVLYSSFFARRARRLSAGQLKRFRSAVSAELIRVNRPERLSLFNATDECAYSFPRWIGRSMLGAFRGTCRYYVSLEPLEKRRVGVSLGTHALLSGAILILISVA